MVPALMTMILVLLCGFLPALNVVSEKEAGTIEQINVSPVSRFTFTLAKLLPYWAIGFVVLNLCMLLAWLVYGLTPAGNVLTIYLATLDWGWSYPITLPPCSRPCSSCGSAC